MNFGSIRMLWIQEKVASLGNKGRRNLEKGSGISVQPLIADSPRYRLLLRPALRQLCPIF